MSEVYGDQTKPGHGKPEKTPPADPEEIPRDNPNHPQRNYPPRTEPPVYPNRPR